MAKLRRILDLLLPPVFIWGYGKLVNKNAQNDEKVFVKDEKQHEKIFVGKYDNFDELRAQLNNETNYYWSGAIEQELNAQKQRIIEWSSEYPPSGNFRTNFLSTALALYPEEKIRVLFLKRFLCVDALFNHQYVYRFKKYDKMITLAVRGKNRHKMFDVGEF